MERIRFVLFFAALFGIFMGIGYCLAGIGGMTLAFLLALMLNFFSYWFSDKIVLSLYHAKPLHDERIEAIVKSLCERANIPVPKLYVIESMQPNAFATGRNAKHAAVAVTRGLMELLSDEEIEGVLSHELAHVRNRDILISTIVATIAGAISYLAEIFWWGMLLGEEERPIWAILPVIILAPVAASLIQLAISRSREFLADETGAKLSGKPLALASALRKISAHAEHVPMQGSVATSHLWIVNPFKEDFLTKLFSTHPPVEERIKRLEDMHKKI